MTPLALVQRELQVLEQAQVPEREQWQERAAQLAQELVRREPELEMQPVLGLEPELEMQPVLGLEPVLELEPAPDLHVFLERLPLRQGSTQHI